MLSRITEADLRAGLEREAAKLRMNRKFGLVFEEHMPEHVRLYQLPITVGAKVVQREDKGDAVFNVIGVEKKNVHLSHEIDGHWEDADADDLVVIKKFGEPIYPSLVQIDHVIRAKDKPYHAIINAENFHALQLLLYCYEGKVDVIYIDPPYNTGSRDWKYNNNYVDSNDQYRHSKWLSMMKKRLLLSKRLLRKGGVLIVTIDDNENHHLQCLLEEVMPDREITSVTIIHNPRGNVSNNFAYTHEYAHFLISKGHSVISRAAKENETPRKMRRWGHNSTRKARPTMFYPIYVRNSKIVRIGEVPPSGFHPASKNIAQKNGEIEVWPIDQKGEERRWNFSRDSITDEFERIIVQKDKKGNYDLFISEEDSVPKTVWSGGELEAGKYGASLVKTIVGNDFPFPKSLYAVHRCLSITTKEKPNALILDFFAGSGTTLHATCLLNAEDGGQRQCILVTNNEVAEKTSNDVKDKGGFPSNPQFEKYGICESVTWPRCKYSVQGKRDDGTILDGEYLSGRKLSEGFEENVQYLRMDYLDPNSIAYREKLSDILPILWLMAGAKGNLEPVTSGKWFIPKHSSFAVLIDETAFADFKKEIVDRNYLSHIFIVTDSEEAYREMSNRLPERFKTKLLYKSYLENFRINTAQNL